MNIPLSPGARFRVSVKEERPLQVVVTINAYDAAHLAERAGFITLHVSGGEVAAGSPGENP